MRLIIILMGLAAATLSGCGPLLVGAGGAVIADKAVEDQQGGDGLFQAPRRTPVQEVSRPRAATPSIAVPISCTALAAMERKTMMSNPVPELRAISIIMWFNPLRAT